MTYYSEHKDVVKAWRLKNPEKAKAINRRSYLKHRKERIAYNLAYIKQHPEKRWAKTPAGKARKRELYHAIRRGVISEYGGQCVCCGEEELDFLTIDHIDGTGQAHRRSTPLAKSIYAWLKKHGFPKENFRVLCMNCNMVRRYGRTCPHERTRPVAQLGSWR
jgi:hypothetical protein